jgi:hypothetical protein
LGAAHLAKAQQRAERAHRPHRAQRGNVQARQGGIANSAMVVKMVIIKN